MIPGAHGLILCWIPKSKSDTRQPQKLKLYMIHQANTDFSYLDGCVSRKFYYASWFVSHIPDTLRFRHDFYHGRRSEKFRVTQWTLELVSVTCMQGRKIQSKILHAYYSVPKKTVRIFSRAFSTILLAHKPSRRNRHNLSRCEKYLESFEAHWFRRLKYLGYTLEKKKRLEPSHGGLV